jgi:hypothetical protein
MLLLPEQAKNGYKARGFEDVAVCQPSTNGSGCPTVPNRSTARQLALAWDSDATLLVPLATGDISDFEALTFRTAVNFSHALNAPGKPQNVSVALIDADGRSRPVAAAHYSNALRPPAGPSHQQITLNGVRIPLDAFRGTDLDRAVAVELRFGHLTHKGSIQVAELALQERR